MDWSDVQARLDDIPQTFRRSGPNYAAWRNSLTAAISRGTVGVDGTVGQIDFATATGKWLDVWGAVFSVPRQAGEGSAAYRTRIQKTCLAWYGTVPGIEAFVGFTLGITATVSEDPPAADGWVLSLPSVTSQTLKSLAATLQNVRPAGVPYVFSVRSSGLYLGTVNFLGAPRTTGAFLNPAASIQPDISATTNQVVNTLPTTLLSDPTINP